MPFNAKDVLMLFCGQRKLLTNHLSGAFKLNSHRASNKTSFLVKK